MTAARQPSQIAALVEVLLGVAYADGSYDDDERSEIEALVAEYAGLDPDEELPQAIYARMLAFDPDAFDVFDAVVRLELHSKDEAMAVLRLAKRMVDADAARDTSEEGFFVTLAKALGLADEAFELLLGFDD